MNIREFAALCGVAHSTVSRILNQPLKKSRASKETYDRIRAKAAEVGFKVNYYAQALHSKNSNCLGLIIGGWMQLFVDPLLYGITNTLNMQEKHLSVLTCDATPESEADAFEKMLIYNAKVVLYIPARQKGSNYTSRHIRKVMEKYPLYPPVITLYGGTDIPEFYHVGLHDYETGKRAAQRQLKKGCRKFGLVQPLYRNFMFREMARGYRETLRVNGIPASDIKELFFWSQGFTTNPSEQLRDIEGIWCGHYVLLLHCIPKLVKLIGDISHLHVDTICGLETMDIYRNLQPFFGADGFQTDFPHWFGSMTIYQYKAQDIGAKAAEVTLRLSQEDQDDMETIPRNTYMKLTSVSFRKNK